MFRFFAKSETGAISVDWTVLTAIAFSLGLITVWWAAGDADDRAAREMGVYFQEAPNGYGAFIPDAPPEQTSAEEAPAEEEAGPTNHAALFDFTSWAPLKLSQSNYDKTYDAAVNLTANQLYTRIGNRFETLKDAVEDGEHPNQIKRKADRLAAFISANDAAGHARRSDHDDMVRYLDEQGLISLPSDDPAPAAMAPPNTNGFWDAFGSWVAALFA